MSTYFKWNIGDHVRVIDVESRFYGREGWVDHYDEDLFHNVFVRFRENNQCNFRIRELEAVE